QAEDGIRAFHVTGVQTCALPIWFAIPSNMVARIANEIIAGHPVKHAFVGVFLNASSTGGAQISSVQPNTPASRAGLKLGDIVTRSEERRVGKGRRQRRRRSMNKE